MIKLKLLAFALFLLSPAAFVALRRNWRIERALSVTMCAQSLLLILLGYVLPFSVCMGILAGISVLAGGYALFKMDKKRWFGNLLVPAAVFGLLLLFLYEVCAPRLFMSYDEYSHWGMMVKAIHLFDELPRAGRGAEYIQFTYPPATAMFPAMAAQLLGYRDGIAYFGYDVLLVGLLAGLSVRAGRGKLKSSVLGAGMVFLIMTSVFPLGMLRLFIEPAAALLMALILMGIWDKKTFCAWETCIYAAMLGAVKNTGLVFLLLCVAVEWWTNRDRAAFRIGCGMLLCALAVTGSYALYCKTQGIAATISPSHFQENLQALKEGTLSSDYTDLPKRYLSFLFGQRLADSGIYSSYGFGTSACVLGFTMLMCAAHVAVAQDRRRALRLWGGVWLCNLLYIGMIVVSYFIGFEPSEVARMAEADRYTMLVPLWTGVFAAALLVYETDTLHPKRRWGLAGALTAAMLPLCHPEMIVKTFVTREYVAHTVWARSGIDRMTDYLEAELGGESKLLCIGEYEYVKLHYTLAGTLDIGKSDHDWKEAAWSGDVQALEEELQNGGYTNVFVAGLENLNEDETTRERLTIDARYAPLMQDGKPPEAYTLYRVEHEADGKIVLSRLSQMPEEP